MSSQTENIHSLEMSQSSSFVVIPPNDELDKVLASPLATLELEVPIKCGKITLKLKVAFSQN